MLRELELLVRAGLTAEEALAAATSVPAASFGLDDRGRVAPGLRADLVLVSGAATTDVRALRDVVAAGPATGAFRLEIDWIELSPAELPE